MAKLLMAHASTHASTQVAWAKREKEQKLVITMAKLRMAHASTHGARKPPGPKVFKRTKILQGLRVAQAAVTERWP